MLCDIFDLLLVSLCFLYAALCPYTKVEESFNLQATHDLLYHAGNLSKYDHFEFSGVVPRTFIGPLVLSFVSKSLVSFAGSLGAAKPISQYIVRCVLGLLVCLAFISFRRAVQTTLGRLTASLLVLITCCQFHFLFYASRPLPNTLALIPALFAFRSWLLGHHAAFIWSSAAAAVLFRAELVGLLGIMMMVELARGRCGVWSALRHSIPAGLLWLGLTVGVDSVFWGRWVWPEGEVLLFNTVLNKSHLWGTKPMWWYFLSALPRSLLLPLFSLPWAVLTEPRSRLPLLCALVYVSLYSLLPHKELRFIIYTIPLFNLGSALAFSNIWRNRRRLPVFLPLGAVCSLLISFGLALCFLTVSRHNYPGGHALSLLHQLVDSNTEMKLGGRVSVHIGGEAAMTGVSRFGEERQSWKVASPHSSYSKREDLVQGSAEMLEFDFLLISVEDYHYYQESHDLVGKSEGFTRLDWSPSLLPPLRIVLEDRILVLAKKSHWISIVQGNVPCTTEQAVKLAAIQYQAYFLDRTAVHSVVGFCRPNEFLPTEFSVIRGLEQKMYKEQEKLKHMKTHKAVHKSYINTMMSLLTYNTVFFPVREPRKKVLQSTKLKPIILGVGPHGILRVDPKTKEVVDHWDYQVLRNWAYSRKTFVLAFTDKNYPVESNQARWISTIVDFFVDSIITTVNPTPVNKS